MGGTTPPYVPLQFFIGTPPRSLVINVWGFGLGASPLWGLPQTTAWIHASLPPRNAVKSKMRMWSQRVKSYQRLEQKLHSMFNTSNMRHVTVRKWSSDVLFLLNSVFSVCGFRGLEVCRAPERAAFSKWKARKVNSISGFRNKAPPWAERAGSASSSLSSHQSQTFLLALVTPQTSQETQSPRWCPSTHVWT